MRLDNFLVENNYYTTRNKAKNAILKGEIKVDGKIIVRPSQDVYEGVKIEIISEKSFVSEGGYKLDKALSDFSFSVKDLICYDVGSSTGGFTDCLIQNGAKKVYSVDLNDELLDVSLKSNLKVVPVIKNARELNSADFADKPDLITADLSFISETYVLPVFSKLCEDGAYLIILIKPQFELDKKIKLKNGIIRDIAERKNACKKVYDSAIVNGFSPLKLTTAPVKKDKNVEYLMLAIKGDTDKFDFNSFNFN